MYRAKATALFTYKSEADDELSFEKGDLIDIKSTKGGHWWYGVHKGLSGCVPKKFLQLQVLGQCKVKKSYVARKGDDLQLLEGNILDILVREKDEWFGRIKDAEGWFPADHVTETTATSPQEQPIPVPKVFRPPVSTSSDFDEITSKAVVLADVRKQRPRKPSATRVSTGRSSDYFEDSPDYDSDEPKTPEEPAEIKPAKMVMTEPAWLTELKKKKVNKNQPIENPVEAEKVVAQAQAPAKDDLVTKIEPENKLEKSKLSHKSSPNLTTQENADSAANHRLSMALQSPRPYVSQHARSTSEDSDSNKFGQMRKAVELIGENRNRSVEQRVEFLENVVTTMMEQLTDMRKEMMKLKSIELQRIVPF